MKATAVWSLRFSASFAGLIFLGWVLTGQAAKPGDQGLPTDWSHSHVIFSKPRSEAQAQLIGSEARYWQQQYRREIPRELADPGAEENPAQPAKVKGRGGAGFWAENLGGAGTPGANNFPAKYGFSLTAANCASAAQPDYVVFSTGKLGAGNQASIVGFDNIYSGCTGTVPSVYWAYNTGGLILTSPVISYDGSQVAFAQTSASPTGNGGLVLLKWQPSATQTVGSPGVPTVVTPALYRSCVAPCGTEIFLQDSGGGNLDDRTSSPFYDYTNDIAWVGSAGGWLHKVTGAFKGTPTAVRSGGFPVKVNTGNALSNPVYDPVSRSVFVGDAGGFLYRVDAATGAVTASGRLDYAVGLAESPLLDVTSRLLYVFSSSDGTANCTGGVACSAVYLLPTTFTAGSKGQEVTVGISVVLGSGTNPNPLYTGSFDSAYLNSTGGNGTMYVCGNTAGPPTIYRVPVVNGVMGSPVPGATLSPAIRNPACSPVTDFANPNASVNKAELLFFSVKNFGTPCANKGCLINFVSLPWQPNTHYNFGQEMLVLRTANNIAYIQVALNSGTTGAAQPTWPGVVGNKTIDGGITWVNQGVTTVTALGAWTANHNYAAQNRILDGTNVEVCITAGRSGATAPTWNTTIGGTTTDNLAKWINAGPWPTTQRTVTGGTGGIIIDNASTATGASQAYFFNLTNQACATSGGTGICATQVSQASLQ